MSGEIRRDNQSGAQLLGCGRVDNPEEGRWLAYYTTPRHEKAVARQFREPIGRLLPASGTSVAALEERRSRPGRTAALPGLRFCAGLEPKLYFKVLSVPGVVSVVGPSRNPSVLDDARDRIAARRIGRAQQPASSLPGGGPKSPNQ